MPLGVYTCQGIYWVRPPDARLQARMWDPFQMARIVSRWPQPTSRGSSRSRSSWRAATLPKLVSGTARVGLTNTRRDGGRPAGGRHQQVGGPIRSGTLTAVRWRGKTARWSRPDFRPRRVDGIASPSGQMICCTGLDHPSREAWPYVVRWLSEREYVTEDLGGRLPHRAEAAARCLTDATSFTIGAHFHHSSAGRGRDRV